MHEIVSPTPKFTHASKIAPGGKENHLLPRATIEMIGAAGSRAFVWGSGKDGRCGNGKESNEKVPAQVASSHRFVMLSCGYHHSAGVTQDGSVLTWGRGIFGQLGHGDT